MYVALDNPLGQAGKSRWDHGRIPSTMLRKDINKLIVRVPTMRLNMRKGVRPADSAASTMARHARPRVAWALML